MTMTTMTHRTQCMSKAPDAPGPRLVPPTHDLKAAIGTILAGLPPVTPSPIVAISVDFGGMTASGTASTAIYRWIAPPTPAVAPAAAPTPSETDGLQAVLTHLQDPEGRKGRPMREPLRTAATGYIAALLNAIKSKGEARARKSTEFSDDSSSSLEPLDLDKAEQTALELDGVKGVVSARDLRYFFRRCAPTVPTPATYHRSRHTVPAADAIRHEDTLPSRAEQMTTRQRAIERPWEATQRQIAQARRDGREAALARQWAREGRRAGSRAAAPLRKHDRATVARVRDRQ